MSGNDIKFLALALVLVCLPLPVFVVMALVGALLVAQPVVWLLALLANPPQPYEVKLVAALNEAVLLMAILVAKVSCLEGNPFPLPSVGPLGLLLAVGLNGFYLRWMLHHALAHQKMQRNYQDQIGERLAAVEADLRAGILDLESARQKEQQVSLDQEMLNSICGVGQQAGGMALLQLACLVLASACGPTEGLWASWTLVISLPGLINSKAQDALLHYYLPKESRLC